MTRFRSSALFTAAVASTVLIGCASAAEALREDANEICGRVRDGFSALPATSPTDTGLEAEGGDQQRFSEFLDTWQATVAALQELRDTWEDPYRGGPGRQAIPRRPGSDMVVAMTLAMVHSKVEEAAKKLTAAADAAGFTECGQRIAWLS